MVIAVSCPVNRQSFIQNLMTRWSVFCWGNFLQVCQVAQCHWILVKMPEVIQHPQELLLHGAHLQAVQAGADGEVYAGHQSRHLLLAVADNWLVANIEPRVMYLGGLNWLSPLILISFSMPCDLCCVPILPKHDPGMVLRQGKVNIIEAKNLATRNNSKGHTKTVQFVSFKNTFVANLNISEIFWGITCKIAVKALQMCSILVLAFGKCVPDYVRNSLD